MEDVKWSKLVRCHNQTYPHRFFLFRENGLEIVLDCQRDIPHHEDGTCIKASLLRDYEKKLIKETIKQEYKY